MIKAYALILNQNKLESKYHIKPNKAQDKNHNDKCRNHSNKGEIEMSKSMTNTSDLFK